MYFPDGGRAAERTRRRQAALGMVLLVAVVAVDMAYDKDVTISAAVTVVPGLVAVNGRARSVVGAGVLAFAVVLLLSWWDGDSADHLFSHVVAVVGATVVGLIVQRHRVRRERELADVRLVADATQRALLRPLPVCAGPVEIAARYVSAAEEALIGGDLYDVLATPWGVRAVIGDVRGKGLPAVRATATALGIFREAAHDEPRLCRIAERIDRALQREGGSEDFVTVLLVGVAADGRCELLSYGHPAPLLRTADGDVCEVPVEHEPPLGLGLVDTAGAGRPGCAELASGEELLLVTDGILEARDAAGQFFPLAERYARLPVGRSPGQVLADLWQQVVQYAGGPPGDDSALVILRRRGPEVPVDS
ncbi:serine/threonine-protein phosphatase [Streptomyces sp. A7024]|uniref:Serine/threonine-protein phosphatase n=2 Tax=Streptomyces coryli TaxID=1128680 RepID=A0A6G4U6Y9_9ACTN|nr:serine/threonine-protein phosphatase [Streptomyces coryli]